jgi:hypothetical protein
VRNERSIPASRDVSPTARLRHGQHRQSDVQLVTTGACVTCHTIAHR